MYYENIKLLSKIAKLIFVYIFRIFPEVLVSITYSESKQRYEQAVSQMLRNLQTMRMINNKGKISYIKCQDLSEN